MRPSRCAPQASRKITYFPRHQKRRLSLQLSMAMEQKTRGRRMQGVAARDNTVAAALLTSRPRLSTPSRSPSCSPRGSCPRSGRRRRAVMTRRGRRTGLPRGRTRPPVGPRGGQGDLQHTALTVTLQRRSSSHPVFRNFRVTKRKCAMLHHLQAAGSRSTLPLYLLLWVN